MAAETRVLHPQWRDENDSIAYPFADSATLRNADGMYVPETTFLDAIIHPVGCLERVYLAQITIDYSTVTLTLGDRGNAGRSTGSFDLLAPPATVRLTDALGRPAGLLVSTADRLAIFQSWPVGVHNFTLEETEFAARCCIPSPEIGVRGIQLADGSFLSDDVWLIGEDGVVLTASAVRVPDPVTGIAETEIAIRVDIVGDPLFRRKTCGEVFETPQFLKQLTVLSDGESFICTPDELGDLRITATDYFVSDTVLRVRTEQGKLRIEAVGARLTHEAAT